MYSSLFIYVVHLCFFFFLGGGGVGGGGGGRSCPSPIACAPMRVEEAMHSTR